MRMVNGNPNQIRKNKMLYQIISPVPETVPEFKQIPGHKGYYATADGQIWSLEKNWRNNGAHMLAQRIDKDGYPTVRLIQKGRRVRRRVHVLVCKAFHGYRSTKRYLVRHLDGNRMNPKAYNVAWGNYSQNAKDRQRHGRCVLTQNARLYQQAAALRTRVSELVQKASEVANE